MGRCHIQGGNGLYISKKKYAYVFSKDNEPAARVEPPAALTFQTMDCSTDRVRSAADDEPIPITEVNPATGPVYIEGAEPGDVLAVTIDRIRLGPTAHIKLIPGNGLCRERVKSPLVRVCRIADGMVDFSPTIKVPVRPMVGTIGTAPAGDAVHTVRGGSHGGNLDNNLIAPGATVYLPVFVPGALLSVGDVHARGGDGELGGLALEAAGEVDLRVRLVKGVDLPAPAGENAEVVFACGFYRTPWQAIDGVAAHCAELLVRRFGLSLEDAAMLISAAGDICFCQCVPGSDEIGISVRIDLPREVLNLGPEEVLF